MGNKTKKQQAPSAIGVCPSRDTDTHGRLQHHPWCLAQNRFLSPALGDAAHKGSWHLSAAWQSVSAPSARGEMLPPCDEDAAGRCALQSPLVSGVSKDRSEHPKPPAPRRTGSVGPEGEGNKEGNKEI